MDYYDRTKWTSFTAISALCGLLIVIIAQRNAFPELLFCYIVVVLITVIVILVVYAFLWQRSVLYIRNKRWTRKQNRLSRKYFEEWRDYVINFTSLKEFENPTIGIIRVLEDLRPKSPPEIASLINGRIDNFGLILHNPFQDFKKVANDLLWHKKKTINHEILKLLVREFENYVKLHKRLYVDLAVTVSGEIKNNVPKKAKRYYSQYKDNYNQFINTYVAFAKKCERDKLDIFSTTLEKAYDFEK